VTFIGSQKTAQEKDLAIADYYKNLQTAPTGGSAPTGGTSTPVGGRYSYADIKPYINFLFEDLGGTARSPTCYIYYSDPTGSSAWGDERAWSDDTGEYDTSSAASSGKVQKQFDSGKEFWSHCSLASYEDIFFHYVVPTRGDISPGDAVDTNAGLSGGTFVMAAWDTDEWNESTTIDMGYSGSFTGQEKNNDETTLVDKQKRVRLSRVRIENVTDYTVNTLKRLKITIGSPCNCVLDVYNYDNGLDNTQYDATDLRVFDSNFVPEYKACLKTCVWEQDEAPSLRVTTKADDTLMANGNIIGHLEVEDMEGNALIGTDASTEVKIVA
jgi:hypothetical protein